MRVEWIPGEFNMTDLITETTMDGNVSNGMVKKIFNNKSVALKK